MANTLYEPDEVSNLDHLEPKNSLAPPRKNSGLASSEPSSGFYGPTSLDGSDSSKQDFNPEEGYLSSMKLGGKKDPDLAKMESSGNHNSKSNDGFYDSNNNQSTDNSKFKSKFKGLGGKKRWAIMVGGGIPTIVGAACLAAFGFFMLSGFQVGQVSRVLKDFNFIFARRASRRNVAAFITAGAELGNRSKYGLRNTGALAKLGLVDIENPERSILKLSSESGGIRIGQDVISTPSGLGKNTVFTVKQRTKAFDQIYESISKEPAFENLSSWTRVQKAKAAFMAEGEGVALKLTRWTKTKNFFRGVKDFKASAKDFFKDTMSKTIGKSPIKFSMNRSRGIANETASVVEEGDVLKTLEGSPAQMATSSGVIRYLKKASDVLAAGASVGKSLSIAAEVVGYICLFQDLRKLILDGQLERTYALGRMAGQAIAAGDQMKTGDTSTLAVGLTAKSMGNIAESIDWQKMTNQKPGVPDSTLEKAGYIKLPENYNMWSKFSWVKQMIIGIGGIKLSKMAALSVPFLNGAILAASFIDGSDGWFDAADAEICNALTSPVGIISTAILEIVVQVVAGILSGGLETGASEAADKAAVTALSKIAAKFGASSLATKIAAKSTSGIIWTMTKSTASLLYNLVGRASIANELQLIASSGNGLDVSGAGPDRNYIGKVRAGSNLLSNIVGQTQLWSRPSSNSERGEVIQTQYEETLLANKNKSFMNRLLSLNNPRSPASLMLTNVFLDKSTITNLPLYALSMPNLLFNPFSSQGAGNKLAEVIDYSQVANAAEVDNEDGYHVWFYSKAEEQKMRTDPSFTPDANAEYVEPILNSLEEKYGKCYKEDEAKMGLDLVSECATLLQEDDALHYRVYKANDQFNQYMDEVASATDKEDGSTSSSGSQQMAPTYNSSDIPCAEGTTDVGEAEAFKDGQPYKIKLCSIPGFVSTATEDVDSGVNLVRVNSTISKDTLDLFKAMQTEKGITPTAVSSFRSNDYQTRQYGDGSSGLVAKPGYSKHQMGYAIDFNLPTCNPGGKDNVGRDNKGCQKVPDKPCSNDTDPAHIEPDESEAYVGNPMWDYLNTNGSKYKFSQLCFEAWHWQHDDVPIMVGGGAVPGGLGPCSSGEIVTENQGQPLNANIEIQKVPGTSIRVVKSLCKNVENMVRDAAVDSVTLNGGGFRTYAEQVNTRRGNCGSSNYAIYETPSGNCSPPTAKPGTSNHEKGVAIDFENCGGHETPCFKWLNANSTKYGFLNYEDEPWHWSVDGN